MKNAKIALTITTALAALLLASCGQQDDDWTTHRDTAVCTDRFGNRVVDDNCQTRYAGNGGSGFAWYYLSGGRSIAPYGSRVSGGSFTRTSDATYFHAPPRTMVTRSQAISRGGFGESAHAFGGFGE